MDLITYTREDIKVYKGRPTIRINSKNGSIAFSKHFAELAGFKSGDKIAFHQDKNRAKDWYVSKTDHLRGLKLRLQANTQLVCTSTGMARKILSSLNNFDKSAGFRMANKPTEDKYFAIITSEGI
jgi:hypothetical protein